jgi:[glutamine synthetase] adenylyltransferase / [glutamine synthetase]-adenylyl-L-tyrosine phosphorylase
MTATARLTQRNRRELRCGGGSGSGNSGAVAGGGDNNWDMVYAMVGIMTRSAELGSTQQCEVLCSTQHSLPSTVLFDAQTTDSTLSGHSRYAVRVRRRFAEFLAYLPHTPLESTALRACYDQLTRSGLDTAAALRSLRALVLERLITQDCDAACPLDEVTTAMTTLAEFALDIACTQAQLSLDGLHGAPQTPTGLRATLWVVGMGKLGARELNVSSDIDLIYVYDEDGETLGNAQGRGRISNHEYFGKVVRNINTLLADVTEHGFVFRVDLALRPNGNSGPPAVSLGALEDYLIAQGREWERFAWLKSRVVAPATAITSAVALRQTVLPFVFRKYLDYNVFDALRVLHRQIRDHATKRAAGRPERANDIKLSRGGIREIEFTVQLLQVVRGGQFPELRTRPTLSALQRIAAAGLMPQTTATAMAQAYVFLRRVEHRIQYLDDQQTHILPTDDADLTWLAHSMGYEDCCPFLSALDAHRELVATEFDRLLGNAGQCMGCGPDSNAEDTFEQQLSGLPERFRERVALWREHPRVLALSETSRVRLLRLVQRTGQWLAEAKVSEEAALRIADWIEPLLRRESYLSLLLERPQVHERLLRVLGTARWPARYLMTHPGVVDELATDVVLHEHFDAAQFEADLQTRADALRGMGQDDDESLMLLLRRAQHAEMFRILVRDVEGRATVEQVADELSALADSILKITARWCWLRLKNRHAEQAQFAIIGYGKLGGKELGYGSDLDIVFVYDDTHEQAGMVYAALVRKLIAWLSVKTGEGDLYEIDTALRPNGSSGLLVSTMAAFEDYQTQRGSNTAWVWEHQAMTRARCVLGSDAMRARFEAVRIAVLCAPRDNALLASEILAMRRKVHVAHRVPTDRFDVKHSEGGMVDVEFAVQYLVLAHSCAMKPLRDNAGNIALLARAETARLLPAGVGTNAATAYRALRHAQHLARLNEASTQLDNTALLAERAAVKALWSAVFTDLAKAAQV